MYQNSYTIAVFACCRHPLNREIHSGCLSLSEFEEIKRKFKGEAVDRILGMQAQKLFQAIKQDYKEVKMQSYNYLSDETLVRNMNWAKVKMIAMKAGFVQLNWNDSLNEDDLMVFDALKKA